MSTRSPIGRPIIGRPRRSRTVGTSINGTAIETVSAWLGLAHGEDGDESVPQVPRIPDEFQSRERDHNSVPEWKTIQEPEDEKVDLKSMPAPYTRYLPNCSIGKPKEVQVISNAMMQAYVAMRGNYLGVEDGNDPLFKWIQQREELAQTSKPKIDHQRDITRMLELIDKALSSTNAGDSPRDGVFEVYRPNFAHIKPERDMDMSPHIFAACCDDFECENTDDSDDDEPNSPSGRISPCTFLEWSKDCKRWNGDDNEHKKETSSYRRMRPPTPEAPMPPQFRGRKSRGPYEHQWDIYTGEVLTPSYNVPSSPSIVYTPPGVEFDGFSSPGFHTQYRRMAPLLEREFRQRLYGGMGEFPKLSDDEKDRFSPTEVNTAAAIVPEFHNFQGPDIDAILKDRWTAVQQTEEAEKALQKHTELQAKHIERLRSDQRHMNRFLPALLMQREMREKKEREARERGEKIRAYVAENARDAQSRLDTAWHRLNGTKAKVSENALLIASLEHDIQELCAEAGVRDPKHAYAVLLGDDTGTDGENGSDSDATFGGNGGSYYPYAYGGMDKGPVGPWSPSSLGRATEDFKRLVAERDKRGTAANGGVDGANGFDGMKYDERYNCGDDSAVSGVECQDPYNLRAEDPDDAGCF
ncbi:hypothetical protein F4861DRAFT_198198 [Xylaria intraflava]|nr:hypothetical protein F4861DRAFT_198198 [Xylaria intraflava]